MKEDTKMTEEGAKADNKTLDDLWAINKTVADRLDELIYLQKIALLGPDRIFKFLHNDELLQIGVPFAERDFIQRNILRSGSFYEIRQLEMLRASNTIAPASIIYDVGANIGNHSLYFAKTFRPRKMISIEPQKQALKLLLQNLQLNEIDTQGVVNCMLGSAEGMGELKNYFPTNLGATAFKESADGAVPMRTLDAVLSEHTDGKVDFVKIDVEGMHVEVLSGAKKMLTEARPSIWIELREFKDEHASATEILSGYGYRQTMKLGAHDFVFAPR